MQSVQVVSLAIAFLLGFQVMALGQRGGASDAPAGSAEALPKGVKAICDMSAGDRYKGEDGGLYGGGNNQPPDTHWQAALAESRKIMPLDKAGQPSPDGKIGFISIGFSNTTQEFQKFLQLLKTIPLPPALVVVDGAQGGRDAPMWANNTAPNGPGPWDILMKRLDAAGITPAQVQVVWLKMVLAGPNAYGEFPKHAQVYKDNMVLIVQRIKKTFPNTRIVYLSTRIYGGYANRGNPEPYAYETGFGVRWLILDQIKGNPELNYDATKGEVKAPILLWGPYLWANGTTPRRDGLVWDVSDYQPDRLHPSVTSGREKVARMLLEFLQTNPTARPWFVGKK
ncbi:MAG: hypothetical protein N3D11_09240 [Candidatus Sumerlaeia bacterium]|nr:hypothetical protein [Candidatus Sumerlaeia bacterium]